MFRYYTPGSPLPEPKQCDACGGRHNIKLEPSISQIFDFHEFEVTIKDPITGEQVQLPVIFIFDDETPSKNLPHLGEDVQIIGILRYSHYTKEKAVPLIEAFNVEKLSPKPIRLQDEVKKSEGEWNTLRKSLQDVSYDVLANYLLPGKIPTEEKLLLLGLMLAPFKEEYGLSESPSALFVRCGEVPHASRLFQSAWNYEKLAPWLVGYYNALVRDGPLLLTKGKEFSPIFGDNKPTLRAEEMLLYKWGTLLIDHGETLSKRELSRIAHWISEGEIYEELGRWVRYRISGGTRVAMSIKLKNSVKDPRKALNRVFGYPDHAKFWFVYFENNDPLREEYNIHLPILPDQYEIMYFAALHSLEVDVDRERFREFMSWFVDNRESATQWGGFRLMNGLYQLAKGLAALKFKRVADEEVFEVLRRISMHLV
ncbi:hypothetical protein [Thermococcus thermotolerans]|uniref:hypothetical protein n=1 Tax=Thermococcus thermotolerans TaxID=2969672 RepID=UPI00215803A0|nr:hypothetical protein [Thermococcus thermotolerans]